MTLLRTRRMEAADEPVFHALFNALPGIVQRSWAGMQRVWHDGPAGPVISWVIEAEQPDGTWRMVGQHGLCPIRYTWGDKDLVFAKTVNTILLPEYRAKFLYLRFERQCLAEAQPGFDASFSVSPQAVRPRAALGYDSDVRMLHFELGLGGLLPRLLVRLAAQGWRGPAKLWSTIATSMHRTSPLALEALDNAAARDAPFFADFWTLARPVAGLAPRRDAADLAWRFWNDADNRRTTLTYTGAGGERAYAIVKHNNPFVYDLEDIFLLPPRPDLLQQFLDALACWAAARGALMLTFWTTSDGQPPDLLEVFRRLFRSSPRRRFRGNRLSRRLTPRGQAVLGPQCPPCNFTIIATPT